MTHARFLTLSLAAFAVLGPTLGCGGPEPAADTAAPVVSSHGADSAPEVAWAASWDDALAAASNQDQAVLVTFYADWCIWCTRLENTTMADREVAGFLAGNLVPVRLDVEGDGERLSRDYGVNGLPTVLIVSAAGEEISRIEGYLPPGDFLEWVKGALA
jgi:thiol:disulfide interchange protein